MNGIELKFRDGERVVPPHVAEYLTDVDTLLVTYREAVEFANRARLTDHLNNVQKKVINEHFKDMRGF